MVDKGPLGGVVRVSINKKIRMCVCVCLCLCMCVFVLKCFFKCVQTPGCELRTFVDMRGVFFVDLAYLLHAHCVEFEAGIYDNRLSKWWHLRRCMHGC